MSTTPRGTALWQAGQGSPNTTVNQTIVRLEAAYNTSVADRDLTAPPGSPSDYDTYLIAASPTGDWSGRSGQLAIYFQGWHYVTPIEGMQVTVRDEDVRLEYDGSTWREVPGLSPTLIVDDQSAASVTAATPQIEFHATSSDTVIGEIGFMSGSDSYLYVKGSDSNGGVRIQTNSGTPVSITGNSVGVGTLTPSLDFQVGPTGTSNTKIALLSGDCRIGRVTNGYGYLGTRDDDWDIEIPFQIRCQGLDGGSAEVREAIAIKPDGADGVKVGIAMAVSETLDFPLTVNGSIGPKTDDAHNLGDATHRWDDIHATNATIQTSDADLKDDIRDLPDHLGLPLIQSLSPKSFKWQDTPEQTITETITETVPVTETVTVLREFERMDIDGNRSIHIAETRVEQPVMEPVPVFDANGNQIDVRYLPKCEQREHEVTHTIPAKTHHRRHSGFVAQEVVDAIHSAGVDLSDFAAICKDPETGQYGMRYTELLGPMVLAIQQLAAQNTDLTARVDALETA